MKLKTDVSRSIFEKTGNFQTVLKIMRDVSRSQANGKLFAQIVKELNLQPDLKSLIKYCQFLYSECRFVPHIGKQQVRTLNAMLSDKRANCVEFSTAVGTFCFWADIPCVFRAVSYTDTEAFVHVFPLVENIPFDLVQGKEFPNDDDIMKLGNTKSYSYYCDENVFP